MKNKKTIIALIFVLLILFAAGIFIYTKKHVTRGEEYTIGKKKSLNYADTLDKDTYKDKIITEMVNTIEYAHSLDGILISGKFVIDSDGYLHITNDDAKSDKKLSDDIKFKTLYYNYNNNFVAAISTENDLYTVTFDDRKYENAKLLKIETKRKVTNFTKLCFQNGSGIESNNTLLVLEDDGNVYDVSSGYRYSDKIKLVFDSILVFEDDTMTTVYGDILEDSKGNEYKIKYAFRTYEESENVDVILIVTKDDKLVFLRSDGGFNHVYERNSRITTINYAGHELHTMDDLTWSFEDGKSASFKAMCDYYYCINELKTEN